MTGASLTPHEQAPLPTGSEPFALGPAMPPGYGGDGGAISPLARFLSALRRFKWVVLLVWVAGIGASFLATKLMPPKYRVQATLNLFRRGDNGTTPIQSRELLDSRQWEELLKTDSVLKPVVESRRLYIRGPRSSGIIPPPLEGPWGPDAGLFDTFERTPQTVHGNYKLSVDGAGNRWTLTNEVTGQTERGNVGEDVGRAFAMRWSPPLASIAGRSIEFEVLTPNEVAADLGSRIQVNMAAMGARFMRLFYEGQDPERTAATLNTVAENFVDVAKQLKRSNLTAEAMVLDTQLTSAKARLDQAQADLQAFRVQAITLPNEGVPITAGTQQTQPTVITDYLGQRRVVDSLKREQQVLRAAMEQARTGALAVDRFEGIGAVQRAPELKTVLAELSTAETQRRRMLDSLTPDHQDVRAITARITDLRTSTLPRYVDAVLERLASEEQRMEARIGTAERELREIPRRTIQEEELKRELAIADEQYRDINRRFELSKLQEASSLPDIAILDRAAPPVEPQKNRAAFILALGTIASLVAALGLAFLLDLLDKRFRYSQQVTSDLGLTILGAVPEIRRAKGTTASAEEAAQVVESFRSIRLNMMHVVGDGSVCLTISSPMPGDGKSLISSNLALSFAEAGFRTILVDGDIRRGELHRTFGLDRRPGLLDYLAREMSLEAVLRSTSHPKLTLITGGTRHRNGPELLGSTRMRDLVADLRTRYDAVIFDSPPLGAGIDPYLLGTLTGNLLLVVRVGETDREFTEAKLQVLDRLPVRLVGAVLNDVQTSMQEYRYYSYSYGYGAEDEREEGETGEPAATPRAALPPDTVSVGGDAAADDDR
ncbi:MAG TPA: polysaccharide biosynthesis tyrosine autokinase [Gemmatimonadales bacterium]|nr:polysaccharide biosynthesis tyrosine autokinase [Gemmatimonadales bacterium]